MIAMNNDHHLEIMKLYDDIKLHQKHELENRKKEIREKIPQIDSIEKSIGNLCIKVAMSALQNMEHREEYLRTLEEDIRTLRIKKSELLVENGYPLDYLELKFNCPKCKDTGFVGLKKCSCYKKKLNKIYYKNSDLFSACKTNNFSNFNLDYYTDNNNGPEKYSPKENMKNIYNTSLSFIDNFKISSENLLFFGRSGTGKTFLSHCIAKELIDKGYFVVYKTADELIKNLKDIRFNDNFTLEDHLINCDLLIIDDLGTEFSSEFSNSEFFNLLNTKLLKNKKMLISTNYTLDKLNSIYSERITSRLFGNFTLCKFYGNDLRFQNNLNK